jgi:DNA-binding transcriptional LysR family regulator
VPWDARTRRRLKLRELDILMTVVQMGGMRKAADHLHMSQPAISKAIADLEHTLGVTLLDRSPQGIEPTEYGRALMKRGIAVFDELREGVQDIDFLADPTAGGVRIGCSPLLAASFVSTVIDRLSRRYPRIVFHLVTAYTEVLHRELSERHVDLLIARRFGPIADERLGYEFLFEDSVVVVAGAQSPWARRRKIELAELANETWVLQPPDTAMGSVAMQAFRASGLDYPRTTVFTHAAEVRFSLLTTGRFLTIYPVSSLRFPIRRPEIKIVPVELPMARMPIGIIVLKNRAISPVARLVIECAREVAKPLTKAAR